MKESEDGTVNLNEVKEIMNVKKRRIYDITNVLEGIDYVKKVQKNTIKWTRGSQDSELEERIEEGYHQLQEQQRESA